MSENPLTPPSDSGVEDVKKSPSPLAFTVNFDSNSKKKFPTRNAYRKEAPESPKQGSETGTYIVEREENERNEEADDLKARKEMSNILEKSGDDDWVSRWAEETVRRTPNEPGSDDSSSRCRRLLPRLPPANSTSTNDSRETEDLLKDTLSVISAIEARSSDKTKTSIKPSGVLAKKSLMTKESKINSEMEAWKRRKNYKPGSLSSVSSRTTKLSCPIDEKAAAPSPASEDGRITRATLRQQQQYSSKKSYQNSKTLNNRSSSSLSSKDAEFQAWKRRKNYNPLQSVANSKKKSITAVSNGRKNDNQNDDNERIHHSLQSSSKVQSGTSGMPPRSASFHYPDGTSMLRLAASTSFSPENPVASSGQTTEDDDDVKTHKTGESLIYSGYRGSKKQAPSDSSARHKLPFNSSKLESLDSLIISTIFSISSKLCYLSSSVLKKSSTFDPELSSHIDTLLNILDEPDLPHLTTKSSSTELSGALRNLKKVGQSLNVMERLVIEYEAEN